MTHRRKYEPAGGVVAVEWTKGEPPYDEQFGALVGEVWEASWHYDGTPTLHINARMYVLQWGKIASGAFTWVTTDARPLPDDVRWARWMRPQSTGTRVTLTLEDWR